MADHQSAEPRRMPDWAVVPFTILGMFAVGAWGLAGIAVAVYFFFTA